MLLRPKYLEKAPHDPQKRVDLRSTIHQGGHEEGHNQGNEERSRRWMLMSHHDESKLRMPTTVTERTGILRTTYWMNNQDKVSAQTATSPILPSGTAG